MLTVTQLAKQFNLSRTTILYYEREGLLEPTSRTASGYRQYGNDAIKRLERILSYRAFGVAVSDIAPMLDSQDEQAREHVLRKQFAQLDEEINALRKQQNAIMGLLQDPTLLRDEQLTKERWTEVMRAAGLSDDDMVNWHKQFEAMEPEGHQTFLESLNIDAEVIREIRSWAQSSANNN